MPWPTPAASRDFAIWKAMNLPSSLTTGFDALIPVGAKGEFPLVRRTKILRLHRAAERQITAVDDQFLVRELRLPLVENDVRLLHSGTSGGHFVGILGGDVRPGDVHALTRH